MNPFRLDSRVRACCRDLAQNPDNWITDGFGVHHRETDESLFGDTYMAPEGVYLELSSRERAYVERAFREWACWFLGL